MKYINSKYSLFDDHDLSFYNDSNGGGYFYNGRAKITIPAETTKLYVSLELYPKNISSAWVIQVYMSDGAYNTSKNSTVQVYYNYNNSGNYGILHLRTNDTNRLQTPITKEKWNKIYLAIDSQAGTVDFYLNGDKVGTYTGYVKTGVKAISAKIDCDKQSGSSYQTRMRNIIISDQYFPINESIIMIPATVTNNGFEFNNSNNLYSTETENSTLQVTPDLSVLNGYKVTAVNVGMGSTELGDTIKNVKLDMGAYSKTKEIPATGNGMYFDGLPTTNINKFTVTATK